MRYETSFHIGERLISIDAPTYFIADIAANHDGSLQRAIDLIHLVAEAGADAVKFQHFLARKIVSDFGFKALGGQIAHQAAWKESVYEVYDKYAYPREWDEALIEAAKEANVDWFTSPYDFDAVDSVASKVDVFKVGSGDITWTDSLVHIAKKGKPVIVATGASSMEDVERAVDAILPHNRELLLMQCNTNYTGSHDNFSHLNLNVLRSFALHWPGLPLGLSDHTPGHAAVLGAVALGARAVEKHFTDDNDREGPDHPFSMNPVSWKDMVDRTRELEDALGDGVKRIEPNETEAAVVQRRCMRYVTDLEAGHRVEASDMEALRPAPTDAVAPYDAAEVHGRVLRQARAAGQAVRLTDFEGSDD